MKKSVLFVLAIVLALCTCTPNGGSDDPNIPEETSELPIEEPEDPEDPEIFDDYFEEYFGNWDYQAVFETETYHLLEAVIDYIDENWTRLFNWNDKSITRFNKYFRNSEEAVILFEREDCVYVLISTYLHSIKTERYLLKDDDLWVGSKWFTFLETILFCDMLMDEMNLTEKIQLMVLALERSKYELTRPMTFNIMISIMLSSNYSPFINDIKPLLHETVTGLAYYLVTSPDCVPPSIAPPPHCRVMDNNKEHNLIKRYANHFINDNK